MQALLGAAGATRKPSEEGAADGRSHELQAV